MRFTTWSNTYIISAVAVLSRILAANAQLPQDIDGLTVTWLQPQPGQVFIAGSEDWVSWYVPKMVETE